jgi:hypothetical protein
MFYLQNEDPLADVIEHAAIAPGIAQYRHCSI